MEWRATESEWRWDQTAVPWSYSMLEVPNGRRIELKGEVAALDFSADGSFPAATTIYSPVQIWDFGEWQATVDRIH
jgi:hypothetical protein